MKYSSPINNNVNILSTVSWNLHFSISENCYFLLKVYVSSKQLFLLVGCSDTSDLVKCHKGYLKHNINTQKNWILFILFISSLDYDELDSFFNNTDTFVPSTDSISA